ncbi:MAG: hypothetical protein Q9225_006639, partial [Loekoesia sp. 1 TL-2023]
MASQPQQPRCSRRTSTISQRRPKQAQQSSHQGPTSPRNGHPPEYRRSIEDEGPPLALRLGPLLRPRQQPLI